MPAETPLIIVDLEATCCDQNSFPRHQMEIIEIGAVAVDPLTGAVGDEFQSFVRPVRHPRLTDFCKGLTHITQAQVGEAEPFPAVHERLVRWLGGFDSHVFCSWGDYDRKQVEQDCRYHDLPFPLSREHRNLKKEFSQALGTKKRYGVGFALRELGLAFEGTPHRGIDDARNIARIYAGMLGLKAGGD